MLGRCMNAVSSGIRNLLSPAVHDCQAIRGFKVRKYLKLRCPKCYFIRINGRLQVDCRQFARHKQREPFDTKMLW